MAAPAPTIRRVRRFLVGPTASGKSAVAERLVLDAPAGAPPIELISMDSMQVYRGLDILTAKPSPQERARAPILGLDLVEPSESFTVARYVTLCEEWERAAHERGATPIFVGGTPLYLKALTHGLFEGPPADPALRRELNERAEREGDEALHADLLRVDPAAAARIHPRDRKRIVRALEVFAQTGERISDLQRQWTLSHGFPRVLVGLSVPRDELHRRIAARVDHMLSAGALEEVRRISAAGGFSREAAAAVGVSELLDVLLGQASLEEARETMIRRTRELARRQGTWFRSFPELHGIDAGAPRSIAEIAQEARRSLELIPAA
ncbi:MAG: tRNA (adenosine(37)-N6)-dimethylallyltransferase MiaA [Planctomycetes bacterium]|nr:tRNA (adenosine(37)-N6)-dimethylallyltransferase MiaA [Planctomycetota bacterium]